MEIKGVEIGDGGGATGGWDENAIGLGIGENEAEKGGEGTWKNAMRTDKR